MEQPTTEIKAPPSKPVGFQFDVKQWLGDHMVMAMSFAEQGMHLKLMCIAWQETPPCTLPNDDAQIARWLGIAETAWVRIHKPKVIKAWKTVPAESDGSGRWVLEGLQRSYLKQVTILASRQAAANVRWSKERESQAPQPTEPTLAVVEDQKSMIWRIGIELLSTEHESSKARQLIGGWIKKFGESTVAEVLAKLSIEPKIRTVADRHTYITGALSQHMAKANKRTAPPRGDIVL